MAGINPSYQTGRQEAIKVKSITSRRIYITFTALKTKIANNENEGYCGPYYNHCDLVANLKQLLGPFPLRIKISG